METQAEPTIGKITATRRNQSGKGHARKLRAQGQIPAVCYGEKAEAVSLSLDPVALVKSLDPGKRRNTVFDLTISDDGATETFQVMVKDVQRDAIRQVLVHVDLIRVSPNTQVEVSVPVEVIGKSEGTKAGGVVHQVLRTLPIRCTPAQIPDKIQVDITPLNLGEAIQIKGLVCPPGVTVTLAPNQSVVQVALPRKVAMPGEGAEAAEGAEGAEGAPAEEGKTPAAEA